MVYKMNIQCDGGCRRNGKPEAIGAAAAVFFLKWHRIRVWTRQLPLYNPPSTNKRAEITAIILALEEALHLYYSLDLEPRVNVTISSGSRYAVGCMTEWIHRWSQNGWINSSGFEVANRDLIEQAADLNEHLQVFGYVTYKWIPRHENKEADKACNDLLDDMENWTTSSTY